jgi:hypothetical protein
MKINRNTSFPHPVLRFKDDYVSNNIFDVTINSILKDGKYILTCDFNIGNQYIDSLLNKGTANFLVEIDCGNTLYRESFVKSKKDNVISIDARNLRDNYNVQVFICASEEILSYSSLDFNSDYSSASISVSPTDIIGYWGAKTFYAYKDWDTTINISRFIRVKRSGKSEIHTPEIDPSDDIIYIKLCEEDYMQYIDLKIYESDSSPFFISEYVLPALIEVLNLNDSEYADKKWHGSLMFKINSNNRLRALYAEGNCFELAQEILENPSSRSLKRLYENFIKRTESDEATFN